MSRRTPGCANRFVLLLGASAANIKIAGTNDSGSTFLSGLTKKTQRTETFPPVTSLTSGVMTTESPSFNPCLTSTPVSVVKPQTTLPLPLKPASRYDINSNVDLIHDVTQPELGRQPYLREGDAISSAFQKRHSGSDLCSRNRHLIEGRPNQPGYRA